MRGDDNDDDEHDYQYDDDDHEHYNHNDVLPGLSGRRLRANGL